jgi:pSer/pThr/pTyr-binding forkhead associated (FHA) protein
VLPPGSASLTVGRHPSSDVLINWDDQVSRLHARLERANGEWELVDDGFSRNGTFVNGKRLSGRRRLRDGDVLRVGVTTATFRMPEASRTADAPDLSTTQRRILVALSRSHRSGGPASDQEIADELYLSVAAVRAHLKVLCARLAVDEPSERDRRARLVERAFAMGLISESDL